MEEEPRVGFEALVRSIYRGAEQLRDEFKLSLKQGLVVMTDAAIKENGGRREFNEDGVCINEGCSEELAALYDLMLKEAIQEDSDYKLDLQSAYAQQLKQVSSKDPSEPTQTLVDIPLAASHEQSQPGDSHDQESNPSQVQERPSSPVAIQSLGSERDDSPCTYPPSPCSSETGESGPRPRPAFRRSDAVHLEESPLRAHGK